jgi:hypothetical protein
MELISVRPAAPPLASHAMQKPPACAGLQSKNLGNFRLPEEKTRNEIKAR